MLKNRLTIIKFKPLSRANLNSLSCFQKLSSVRIVEDLSTLWGDWFPDDPSYTENGARLFETITTALFVSGLEIDELHLESAGTGSPAFTEIIQNLSSAALVPYPLRAISLNALEIQNPLYLLNFIRRHALTLKNIALSEISLEEGSWETVIVGMREFLDLDLVRIKGLMQDWIDIGIGKSWWTFHNTTSSSFIQRGSNDNLLELAWLPHDVVGN
ncbi:hypothetical protein F5884DRAFT_869553 [Xylogone sp. PMI_703]|nr:hypothetical protein F5884DRAFT_869553 [Xylogone sp. PMI_703]